MTRYSLHQDFWDLQLLLVDVYCFDDLSGLMTHVLFIDKGCKPWTRVHATLRHIKFLTLLIAKDVFTTVPQCRAVAKTTPRASSTSHIWFNLSITLIGVVSFWGRLTVCIWTLEQFWAFILFAWGQERRHFFVGHVRESNFLDALILVLV